MAETNIEWADKVWNPITGCTPISPGCENCYAKRMAKRLKGMGQYNYRNGFKVTLQPHMLDRPHEWKSPRNIFVNSMSDVFHRDVPEDYIKEVFAEMHKASHHTFKVLTKRSERLAQLSSKLEWTENIWMGVSMENADYLYRADHLRQVSAAVRFLSLEPLLGPIPELDLSDIDWVIVGGESGPGSRPIKREWVLDILSICKTSQVPFFFKQWGGVNKKKAGRLLNGRTFDGTPISG